MLAKENELLCRVGPGTPMGNHAARVLDPGDAARTSCRSPDCPPMRVRLLGEPHRLPDDPPARSA